MWAHWSETGDGSAALAPVLALEEPGLWAAVAPALELDGLDTAGEVCRRLRFSVFWFTVSTLRPPSLVGLGRQTLFLSLWVGSGFATALGFDPWGAGCLADDPLR